VIKFLISVTCIVSPSQVDQSNLLYKQNSPEIIVNERSTSEDEKIPRLRVFFPVYSSGTTGVSLSSLEICFSENGNPFLFDLNPNKDLEINTVVKNNIINNVRYVQDNNFSKYNKRQEPILKRKRYPGRR